MIDPLWLRKEIIQMLHAIIAGYLDEVTPSDIDQLLTDQRIALAMDKSKASLLEQRGDFSLPVFKFAKMLKKNPLDLAKEIAEELLVRNYELSVPLISKAWAVQGYVNIRVDDEAEDTLLSKMISYFLFEEPFRINEEKKRILIEHTSTNPMKPLHIGHTRNAILGDTLARIYRYAGWDVEVQNYIDDLGRQVAITLWGMEQIEHKLRNGEIKLNSFLADDVDPEYLEELQEQLEKGDMKEDLFQGIVYVWATQQLESGNPKVAEEIEKIMKALEHREEPYISRGRQLTLECIREQLRTAWELGIFYDYLVWESDLIESGVYDEALKVMLQTPHVYKVEEGEDKGCIVINFKGFKGISAKKPYKILVRSNGVATYVAKDIAYTFWKFGLTTTDLKFKLLLRQPNGQDLFTSDPTGATINRERKIDYLINVIGKEQTYAQKVVFYALKVLGHEQQYNNSYHLAYNHVKLIGSKISGRKGNWIGSHADNVIKMTKERALQELRLRNQDKNPEELEEQAEKLTISQIRYFMLRPQVLTEITYNPDDVVNFQGDNGAFILYCLVRSRSIFKKMNINLEELAENRNPNDVQKLLGLLKRSEERILIKDIINVPYVLLQVLNNKDPSILVQHLYVLARDFNAFYENCPIKNESDKDVQLARLELLWIFTKLMENICTHLMGMPIPDFM